MLIIGLNAYHGDASACVLSDGAIVAAAEEERFRRVKHWAGFPSESIRYCLREARASLSDVTHIAVNSDPSASFFRKLRFALKNRPSPSYILDRLRNVSRRHSIESELEAAFPGSRFSGTIQRVEHHVAHLASAFLVSPFEEATAVSIDGSGDFASTAWGTGKGTALDVEGRVYFPHSLGAFYQAVTQYLGFPSYGDEYKVMGLAPYGKPSFMAQMQRIVRLLPQGTFELDMRYFRHGTERVPYQWSGGSPHVGRLYSAELEELLGPARSKDDELTDRHRDIAHSVQAMYELVFFHLIDHLHERHRLNDLTLAGGCAMNSVANGKVARRSKFKRVYVQSAAGDAGGAIGAAIFTWHRLTPARTDNEQRPLALTGDALRGRTVMEHAYLGPSYAEPAIATLLAERASELTAAGCTVTRIDDEGDLCKRAAEAIAAGSVVGWFQGRMEWGPRALGNRSILCDPRRGDMKAVLNAKIKRRESFRPFAPSVQSEHVGQWFEEDGDVPFMMQVYQIRENKRAQIPAVTHVDGSGRLQTVYRATNPRYWDLIEEFRALTGVPMVLNTSFNENEPVVCRPEEALDCFMRTKMDVLVLGDHLVTRA